jgi:hypothetical protein
MGEVGGKAAIELSRHGGGRIDQHGMAAFAGAGQKQRGPQRIAVGRWHDDVVGKDIVKPSVRHRNPRNFSRRFNKCEFSFCRKGLT